MAISQTITDIPTPPSSSDATNFRTRADAFMASLDTLSTELNTFASQANALETNVNSKEASATSSAYIALASSNFKGAWDIGTAYTVPSSVLHGGTYYMALINSTGQTPPNATYWEPINISSSISYDNTTSGLTATNVQSAIDEVVLEKAQFESSIIFEGSSADTYETTLTVIDPTADRTITIPDKSMTLAGEDVVIGVGQTWQDVTASRALGTTYTNSTEKPIEILVSINSGTSGRVDLILNSGSGSPVINGTGLYCTISVVIPSGDTYRLNAITGSPSILLWQELR